MSDVVMPQMGESIAEGTIVRWIKKVGERVDRDEPLFEISTDKVDAEIPSPTAGVLLEIRAKEGETVPVNSVVAVIGDAAAAGVPAAAAAPVLPPPAPPAAAAPSAPPAPARVEPLAAPAAAPAAPARIEPAVPASADDLRRQKSSPLVRKIAREHNVEIAQIPGTGLGGRVTKNDILGFIGGPPAPAPAPAPTAAAPAPATHAPAYKPGENVEVVPMSVMRKKIAEHMVFSKRTSAHVHSVFEVDYTRISKIRQAKKADYERAGAKLTFMSFIIKAVVDGLKAVPIVNTSIDGDNVVYKKDVNIGVAVALDWGLIVPVIKRADEKNLLGLSRAVVDLAARARAKQLKPDEVQGGTFTITNPGVFGALFGMPVISQPQVAILGVGHIEQRVAVIGDAIAIRMKGYLTLGYDHRLIDGAVADEFMSHVKKQLENWDAASV
ncbi:MAG: dihydrolipoamide acetyltransferase family protein [Vicinamibacterales bacterium]|nr:dihydrolipoamide acetyltransferase family protein [Vicinamibacterales bacterium]